MVFPLFLFLKFRLHGVHLFNRSLGMCVDICFLSLYAVTWFLHCGEKPMSDFLSLGIVGVCILCLQLNMVLLWFCIMVRSGIWHFLILLVDFSVVSGMVRLLSENPSRPGKMPELCMQNIILLKTSIHSILLPALTNP